MQPTGIDEPLSYEYPLMLNWSEIKAKKRDEYDSKNGRGHGKVISYALLSSYFFCHCLCHLIECLSTLYSSMM